MAASRRLAAAASSAAAHSEREDQGLRMLTWLLNVDGASHGEANPNGSTCHTSEPAAAPTASWRCNARSAGE